MAEQLKLASQHCGGIASNEDLALFLHAHIPGRVSEIAHRLTQYRNTSDQFNHRSSEDSTTYTGPLYQITEQSNTLTATEQSSSSPIGQLILGGVLLFTLAFGTVIAIDQWSASNPVVTKPAQMGSGEQLKLNLPNHLPIRKIKFKYRSETNRKHLSTKEHS